MKKLTLLSLILLITGFSFAQSNLNGCNAPTAGEYLHGNNIRAYISGGGGLFLDGEEASFQVPVPEQAHSIFAQGLWLGALDPAGNLKVAAQTYGLAYGYTDYSAGPLNEMAATNEEICQNWDRVWTVFGYQIETHIQDISDNGAIDNTPFPEIMSWPGQGNPHFFDIFGFELPNTPQGLAPFFDFDGDGIYDPMAGDYPFVHQSGTVIPGQITWSIFNDAGNIHFESHGDPLNMEIQLTTWALQCTDNRQMNNTIFTSYKLINRGIETLDSLHLGLWIDFELGCYTNDYVGSAPSLNTVFVYNQDNEDQVDCQLGITGYGENPPVQAVTVLNKNLSYLIYYIAGAVSYPPPGVVAPNTAIEYYRFLTGRWGNGSPLTSGGLGYDPTLSNPVANFAFPGDPNDPNEWSMYNVDPPFNYRMVVASIFLSELLPGAVEEVDVAYSYFREEGADHLENVTAMYKGVEALQNWYYNKFKGLCSPVALCTEDCIWTGDLNADGIANHCDLLALAVAENAQGPTRGVPYNWSPQAGTNWSGMQLNGANYKHIDADGNGSVSFEDFLLSEQHYNLTRPGYQPPAPEYQEGPELQLDVVGPLFQFDFNNLAPGQASSLGQLRLTTAVPDLYALAFSIEYDTAYFEFIHGLPSGFDLDERIFRSGFSNPSFPDQFDYAIVATNGTIEEGTLPGLVQLMVKAEFLYPLSANTSLIRFKNIKAIQNDGTEIEIGGTTIEAFFPSIIVDTKEPLAANDIRLFPNPTSGQLELRFPGQQADGIEVLDATGKQLWRQQARLSDAASLDLRHLPQGIYFVKVQMGEVVRVKKVVLRD